MSQDVASRFGYGRGVCVDGVAVRTRHGDHVPTSEAPVEALRGHEFPPHDAVRRSDTFLERPSGTRKKNWNQKPSMAREHTREVFQQREVLRV